MNASDGQGFFWAIELPGLIESQARRVVEIVKGHAPDIVEGVADLDGLLVDPRKWYTVHVDRSTVLVVREALQNFDSDRVSQGMAEDMEEWLSYNEEFGSSE